MIAKRPLKILIHEYVNSVDCPARSGSTRRNVSMVLEFLLPLKLSEKRFEEGCWSNGFSLFTESATVYPLINAVPHVLCVANS